MEPLENLYIGCECHSPEHQFLLVKDLDDNMVWMQIHLSNNNTITQRLLSAIRHIFGYRSKYGDFDSIIISPTDQLKIIDFLQTKIDKT